MNKYQQFILLVLIMALFQFYYTYFRVSMIARHRMKPWIKALKRIKG